MQVFVAELAGEMSPGRGGGGGSRKLRRGGPMESMCICTFEGSFGGNGTGTGIGTGYIIFVDHRKIGKE